LGTAALSPESTWHSKGNL